MQYIPSFTAENESFQHELLSRSVQFHLAWYGSVFDLNSIMIKVWLDWVLIHTERLRLRTASKIVTLSYFFAINQSVTAYSLVQWWRIRFLCGRLPVQIQDNSHLCWCIWGSYWPPCWLSRCSTRGGSQGMYIAFVSAEVNMVSNGWL